jgi:xanthine dehydrogenase accessory factor
MRRDAEAIHRRIADLLRDRRQFVVASISEVKGSSPQRPGARMIVHHDGSFEFTIGGGAFEAEVLKDAMASFQIEKPVSRQYKLTKNDLGMYCQGLVTVLFERFAPRPRLLIFGGGHVGQALSKLAAATELFQVTVVDDRAEFASREKHPAADDVIVTDRHFLSDVPEVDNNTFIAVITRCHATDQLLVRRYLQLPRAYLGLIGSAAKIRQFRKELMESGVTEGMLQGLYAPIGLPIGGKDPAEVALSILAEVVQVKNQADAALQSSVTSQTGA